MSTDHWLPGAAHFPRAVFQRLSGRGPLRILRLVKRNTILITFVILALAALVAAGAYFMKNRLSRATTYLGKVDPGGPARIKSEFTVFTKATPVENDNTLGHRFYFNDEHRSLHLLNLYFVECPPLEVDESTNLALTRLSAYFGDVPLDKLAEMGGTSRDVAQKQLLRPFRIATLFEPSKQRPGIYGFVLLRKPDGSEEYLSEFLVREGLAAIRPEGSHLPYGEPRARYREYLVGLEKKAKEAKRGIWAFSRHPEEGGVKDEPAAK